MKKFLFILALLVSVSPYAYAQQTPANTPPRPDTATNTESEAKQEPAPSASPDKREEKTPPALLTVRQNADQLFNERDLDKDKSISNYEYVTFFNGRFNYMDQDDNGRVTLQECLWAFGEGDLKDVPEGKILSGHLFLENQDINEDGEITEYESLQNANKFFKDMDTDNNDSIDSEEYFASMQKGKHIKKEQE